MENYKDIVKRFKFDLEMGRFIEYHRSSYLFKSNTRLEIEFLHELLLDIGFHTKETYNESYTAVVLEVSTKFFIECNLANDCTLPYNEIPTYIKKFLQIGKKWN